NVGLKHYKHNPIYSDDELAALKLNRITDTVEPESNLDNIEEILDKILDSIDASKPISPTILHRMIGEYLHKNYPNERGILKSAYEKNVPVAVPAFVDSELGNDVYTHNLKRLIEKKSKILMDMELDTKVLLEMMTKAVIAGIFTIGGGVPRNNTQNVAPLIEIINNRLRLNLKQTMFFYGTRVCPDSMHYGHLGGCSYSENKSWRKMDLKGSFVEVKGDATKILPFIAKYALERAA
ncbi:MAG: deoxyhypusine synthase family protein, partial [Nanoarchaeota archaeon]